MAEFFDEHCSLGEGDDKLAGCGWRIRCRHKGREGKPKWIMERPSSENFLQRTHEHGTLFIGAYRNAQELFYPWQLEMAHHDAALA